MKRRILLVEDDEVFQKAITNSLQIDYSVEEATTIPDALRALDAKPQIQVIILSLELAMNDRSLLERIKAKTSDCRIVGLTGLDSSPFHSEAKEMGLFAYLPRSSISSLGFAINQAFKDISINEILAVQEAINTDQSLKETLQLICSYALEQVGGYTCHIRVYDSNTGDYSLAAYAGPPNVKSIFSQTKRINESFSGKVANQKRPLVVQSLQNDSEFREMKKHLLMGNGVKKEGVEYLDTVRSHYVVPISTGEFENEVDAVFSMSSEFEDFFSTERRKIIDDFVTQTSLAIGKDLLRKKRQEVHRDYSMSSQLLVQISEQLKGENILENIYDIVAQGIVDIVNPELVSIFLFNERTNKLEKVAERIANNPQRNLNETYSPGESLTGTVFARGETIRLNNDPTHHPNYSPSSEERDVLKLASGRLVHYLGVPLVDGSKIVGVIRVINKRSEYYDEPRERPRRNDEIDLLKRGFSQDSQTVLTIIASHLSVAIKNAELVNRLSGRINQLETLSDVARRVSSNYGVEIDDLLDLIVRKTAEVTNSSICMLFLRDEHERDRIVLKQVYGIPKLEGIYYKIGEGKIGHAAASGTSILEKSADKSHRGKYDDLIRKALRNEEGKDEIESFMAAPIVVEDMSRISGEDIIGVLQVINKKDDHRHFDEDDLHVFKTFASQIGVALALAERTYALSQLVGGVCHEINNTSPLIPPTVKKIKQLLGTIDGEVEKRLDRIDALARQTVEFANDLLGFSGSALQEKKSVDINELVKSALEYISPDTVSIENYHTVTLVLQLSEHPIRCNVYPTPFIHIIRNIIVNAYHATEEKEQGCIIIRTYLDPTGQTAYLEFVDNGRGIKREHLSKIFSPDFSTKKGVKGNGLGLWMVKTYLSRMGGTIAVRSEVGQGATFTIRIRAIIGVN